MQLLQARMQRIFKRLQDMSAYDVSNVATALAAIEEDVNRLARKRKQEPIAKRAKPSYARRRHSDDEDAEPQFTRRPSKKRARSTFITTPMSPSSCQDKPGDVVEVEMQEEKEED